VPLPLLLLLLLLLPLLSLLLLLLPSTRRGGVSLAVLVPEVGVLGDFTCGKGGGGQGCH
jgi:hypothetical protein